MKFDDAVQAISRINELRRISGAHVVDHRQLSNTELKAAIIKAKPQYLHQETVHNNLETVLYREPRNDFRVVSRLILIDVLLNQYNFEMPYSQTEQSLIAIEQSIVNKSNEIDLVNLGCTNRESDHHKNLELYNFVLKIAWENENTKSPDEVNLLRKLRGRLSVTESDHRLIEAKLGNYPKPSNELHSRTEIHEVRRYLQGMGLLFAIRHDGNEDDMDIIPDELANTIREILGLELRADSYRALMDHKPLRRRNHLALVLERSGVEIGRNDTVEALVERVLDYVRPSKAITSISPRYGLNNDQLAEWCRNLHEPVSGTMEDRLERIISHYDQLRPRVEQSIDERSSWYDFYPELASRSYDALRSQHIIEKDLEIEAKFENATEYLFAEKLNHTPLRHPGSNNPDGLLSLGNNYVMWDNKSKESPVNLRDHLRQFDEYMDQADKPVPIFLVIGPSFSPESEAESIRYHARHFDRNIALITANELKDLADEWSSTSNTNRDEPFPLGLLAATGRFQRSRLGKL